MAPKWNRIADNGTGSSYLPTEIPDPGLNREEYEDAYAILESYLTTEEGLYPDDEQESRRLLIYTEQGEVKPCSTEFAKTPEGREELVRAAMSKRLYAYRLGKMERDQIILYPPEKTAEKNPDSQAKWGLERHQINYDLEDELNQYDQKLSQKKPEISGWMRFMHTLFGKNAYREEFRQAEEYERTKTGLTERLKESDELPSEIEDVIRQKPKISGWMRFFHTVSFGLAYKSEFRRAEESDRRVNGFIDTYRDSFKKVTGAFDQCDKDRDKALSYYTAEEMAAGKEKEIFEDLEKGNKTVRNIVGRKWRDEEDKSEEKLSEYIEAERKNQQLKRVHNKTERARSQARYDNQESLIRPHDIEAHGRAADRVRQEYAYHRALTERRQNEAAARQEAAENVKQADVSVQETQAGNAVSEKKAGTVIREWIQAAADGNPMSEKGSESMKKAIGLFKEAQGSDKLSRDEEDELQPYIRGFRKLEQMLEDGRAAGDALQKHEYGSEVLNDEKKHRMEDDVTVFRELERRLQNYALQVPAAGEGEEKALSEWPPKAFTHENSPLFMLSGLTTVKKMKKLILEVVSDPEKTGKGTSVTPGEVKAAAEKIRKQAKLGFSEQAEVIRFNLSKEEIDYKTSRTENTPGYDPEAKDKSIDVKLNDLPKNTKSRNGTKKTEIAHVN